MDNCIVDTLGQKKGPFAFLSKTMLHLLNGAPINKKSHRMELLGRFSVQRAGGGGKTKMRTRPFSS